MARESCTCRAVSCHAVPDDAARNAHPADQTTAAAAISTAAAATVAAAAITTVTHAPAAHTGTTRGGSRSRPRRACPE